MSRRGRGRGPGVAALALAAALLGGCGVATETGVVRDADGPRGQSDPGKFSEPPKRQDALTEQGTFIDNYLRSASPDPRVSVERLRDYMPQNVGSSWQPDPTVTIVRKVGQYRVTPTGGGGAEVSVRLQPVGTLSELGAVEPPANRDVIDYPFNVSPSGEPGQKGLFLLNPRPQILLLDTALAQSELYLPYTIYFWDNEDRALVPDLRYLSMSIPEQQRPTEVLRWLLNGPSPLLRQTAHGLPAGTELRGGNVYRQDDRLMVNLSAKAAGVSTALLMPQLRWSLWRLDPGKIGLLIEGQRTATDDSPDTYRSDNAAAVLPEVPEVMCVAGGVVIGHCDEPGVGPQPAAVAAAENTGVLSAAISAEPGRPTRAALVRGDGKNRRRLWVGQLTGPNARPSFAPTELVAAAMSRPVWLRVWGANPPMQTGLVAAKGELYRFVATTGVEVGKPLDVPVENENRVLDEITTVAAAPDARRIALIAGGRLYVAPLLVIGGAVSVGAARPIDASLPELTAVTFNAECRLLVAGEEAGNGWITDVSVDGVLVKRYTSNLGNIKVSQLVAYPDDPVDRLPRGLVMIEGSGRAFRVFDTAPEDIDRVAAPASPAGGPVKTAPFYVD